MPKNVAEKLMIKEGQRFLLLNEPSNYKGVGGTITERGHDLHGAEGSVRGYPSFRGFKERTQPKAAKTQNLSRLRRNRMGYLS